MSYRDGPAYNGEKYNRELFKHWRKGDGGMYDARHFCIYRCLLKDEHDMNLSGYFSDPKTGKVLSGFMHCAYTGDVFNVADVTPDADHIIPLKASWLRGANGWDSDMREEFANDQINLVAVRKGANRQKSADGIADWIPNRLGWIREYLDKVEPIAEKYPLTFTDRDKRAWEFMNKYADWAEKGIRVDDIESFLGKHLGWEGWK